ncbi:MAG TPA: copper resistance protein CopC, partial [Candidatus Thermoplasmatota archaeon]|nr:copper resistance protein CopC [Candidatus Thermoplasmatota archaeon]
MPHRAAGRLALLAALALLLPVAHAHANLASSDPPAGARLDRAPALVTLTMTEPVDPAGTRVEVTDCAGRRVDRGDLSITPGPNPVLRLGLQEGLGDGAYAIHWATFSATDAHHIDGLVGFAVGPHATPCPVHVHTHGHGLAAPAALARALAYAGFSLAFGGAAFLAWLRRPPEGLVRGAIALGAALHLAGTLLLVQLTLDEVGLGWDRIGASAVGRVLLARVLLGAGALVLAVLAQARPTRTGPWAAVLLLLAAGLGAARLGHGSSDGPATIALDLLHLVTATAWVGSLALLLVELGRGLRGGADPAALRAMGRRYGTLAFACVALLWSTGAIVALAILGREGILHPGHTLASPYGAFLAGKMALATLMLAIAALNRYVFLEAPAGRGVTGALQGGVRRLSGGRAGPLS